MPSGQVDKEFDGVQSRILGQAVVRPFRDSFNRRLSDAVGLLADGRATPADAAVLIRQLARRRSSNQESVVAIRVPRGRPWYSSPGEWKRHHMQVIGRTEGVFTLVAEDWEPAWLPSQGSRRVDDPASAGTEVGLRRPDYRVRADPVFTEITGYRYYRSPGQRTAVRTALTMLPGESVICLLPTGSGKTEVALMLALAGSVLGTSLVVVPTVSLALDLERRMTEHQSSATHHGAYAWVGSTDSATRLRIREALVDGSQRVLFTSPESLLGPLRGVVLQAAVAGRIKALVIDEAHLVRQWGIDFRPEFRELSDLRMSLLDIAASYNHEPPKTLLLSATLSQADIEDLEAQFGRPNRATLVAANSLRPEPTYWIASASSGSERRRRVLELVGHLPRPLILYVSRPQAANDWRLWLAQEGYRRLEVVTGQSAGDERRRVLQGLRGDAGSPSQFDVVIATSAFGLGIDYGEIRSIVHACIPETVDRWYQEVGRAGRDGYVASAVLVPAHEDESVARSLSSTVLLTSANAQERWDSLWTHSRRDEGSMEVDLNTPRAMDVQPGSYNQLYNRQLLQGLRDLGAIRVERSELGDREPEGRWKAGPLWVRISVLDPAIHSVQFWTHRWENYRQSKIGASRSRLHKMLDVLGQRVRVCDTLAEAFEPGASITARYGSAADTMAPALSCGQCAACGGSRWIAHQVVSPPPLWGTNSELSDPLASLFESRRTGPNLIVATVDTTDGTKRDELVHVGVELLLRHGVSYISAPGEILDELDLASRRGVFVDEVPPDPIFSPNVASVVVLPSYQTELDPGWLLTGRTRPNGANPPTILIARSDIRIAGEVKRLDASRSIVTLQQLITLLETR